MLSSLSGSLFLGFSESKHSTADPRRTQRRAEEPGLPNLRLLKHSAVLHIF